MGDLSSYQPIIIIGAARSGTNMLRDALTRVVGIGTWPCDEINYIWRHGNCRHPDDEFTPEMATPAVRKFIRRAFERMARRLDVRYLVEKTCANSLRVGFVDRIVPEAKYLFLVRDGRDVVASAMKRWKARLDIPYILRKARFVPLGDLPYYGLRYLCNRVARALSKERRLAFWGPRFEGIQRALSECCLVEVCALQWSRSTQLSEEHLSGIDNERVYRLRYEDFVRSPAEEFLRITASLGIDCSAEKASEVSKSVSGASVGKWERDEEKEAVLRALPLMQESLNRYGYE